MGYKTMDLFHGFQSKRHEKSIKNLQIDDHNALKFYDQDLHFVVIRLPSSWVLKLITRALFLALVIVSLPWLNTIIGDLASNLNATKMINISQADQIAFADPINVELLPMLFHDLANEGLLKMGDRALILSNHNEDDDQAIFNTQFIRDHNMDIMSYSDSNRQSLIPNETYDFVFVHNFHATSELIERTLKKDGIVVVKLSDNPMFSFSKPSNYKIAYLRRFDDSTIIAMRKMRTHEVMDSTHSTAASTTRRRLFGLTTEVKKKALNNLEDVLLEPPRAASGKSNSYRKRTRFLPDLIGDSLENYPRRVFIDVGLPDKINDASWFSNNYPTKNTKFEMYKIETISTDNQDVVPSSRRSSEVAQIGMSDWLRKNLKGNEYVVMKAEAEVVEELVRSKAIKLVDELFLECKHRGIKKSVKRSRRPYWECLALYGMLRDEGVYGPSLGANKAAMWEELRRIKEWDAPWMIRVEFNTIRFSEERLGCERFSPAMHELNDFIDEKELIVPLIGSKYTWASLRSPSQYIKNR
ncbi:hypothetical protein ACH5RR_034700 [Cinchona calisaya]|uniref:DUF7870 domain-containing protein n=1 Tax=Cinchona calisaya TaxID=153742 RepID=A0ABD2YF35_9GENT